MRGIHCCSIERLNSLVIIGAESCEKSFHGQYGIGMSDRTYSPPPPKNKTKQKKTQNG